MSNSGPSDYEKKLIEMQYQMKVNNECMQDTFLDLDNWSKEMKVKESEILTNPDLVKKQNKGLPPIRTLAEPKKKKKKKVKTSAENKTTQVKNTKKINSYDYRSWDKLDVDKLCQEIDNKKSSESSSEYTTDDEWQEEHLKTKANWEKERGNHFFKENLLNEAIECYTKAIDLDPLNPIFLANRAMCLIKQEKYSAAEKDCTLSISLDPKYTKAYHRRASCRVNLKRYEEAKNDYESLMKLEPDNKLFQTELNKIQKLIDQNQLVFPITKTESQKSTKPLKRILIEEINDDSAEKAEMDRNLEQINQKIKLTSQDEKLFEIKKKEPAKEATKMNEIDLEEKLKETKLDYHDEQSKQKPDDKIVKQENLIHEIPDNPTNAYQFKKDWQRISSRINDLALYFKKIPPNDYAKIFLNGLESDMLSKILIIFKENFLNDPDMNLYNHLKCLGQVKRFKTQLMFLTADDKKIIKELFAHVKSKVSKEEMEDINKLYE